MSNHSIRKAFSIILNNWAIQKTPIVRIFYENVNEDSRSIYVENYMFPAENECDFLDGNHVRYSGFFQFSVVGLKDVGTGDVELMAKEIADLFPCYSTLTQDGLDIIITNPPSVMRGIPNKKNWTVPVTVYYECNTTQ